MTIVWRVTALSQADTPIDVLLETSDDATTDEMFRALRQAGFEATDGAIDGNPVDTEAALGTSGLRHGAKLHVDLPRMVRRSGWYLVVVAGPDTGRFAHVSEESVSVGRAGSNTLAVRDPLLSSTHFRVRHSDGRVLVEDAGSTNGTLLEGSRIEGSDNAYERAFISAGSSTFGLIHVDDESLRQVERRNDGPVDTFHSRFRDSLEPLPEKLEHPEDPRNRSPSGQASSLRLWISSAIAIAMLSGLVVFLILWLSGAVDLSLRSPFRGGDLIRNIMYIMMPLMLMTTGIDAIAQLRKKRKDKRELAEKVQKFEHDREILLTTLDRLRTEERDRDRWSAASAGLATLFASMHHSRLWERSRDHDTGYEDFCEIAIGLYDRPSLIAVQKAPEGAEFGFDLQKSMVLRHSLSSGGSLAVVGETDRGRGLARALILDVASSHSPNEVKIWLLTDAEDHTAQPAWNGMRWLPHVALDNSSTAMYSTAADRDAALAQLRSVVASRAEDSTRARQHSFSPTYVFVADCARQIDSEQLAYLLEKGPPVGVLGVVMSTSAPHQGTRAEIKLGEFADEADFISDTQPRVAGIRSCSMEPDVFEEACRSLAPLETADKRQATQHRSEVIRLADLLDMATEDDSAGIDQILSNWAEGGKSRVRVGGFGERVIDLDIVHDGPHGLVGGATRSGKTEFLKSLFTASAVANHPDDLSIVIIDFKGGVDHELSARLPHVVDLSTNQNVDLFVRNVQLIEAEMQRRQRMFRDAGAPNLDAYHAARAKDASLHAVPRLLIVVDEFSEMLRSETGRENLASLESVTRIGGGLGVHLLLVTQNFENQLPAQIAANAGLRVCFRVQEQAHSKAVLGSAEAASIRPEHIGRAYLRIKGGSAVEFQAARVAGPRPGKEAETVPVVLRLAPFESLPEAPPPQQIVDVPAEDTDMHAMIEAVRAAAARSGWQKPAIPWPKELPRNLGVSATAADMAWPLGLVDVPDEQTQRPFGLAEYGPHALFVGGAGARLGEILRAVVVSGAMRRGPTELHFYVIDNLGGLASLASLPHVGGVAERNETLGLRILRHVAREVAKRKSRMSELGMANIGELQSVEAEQAADVVLLVHGAGQLIGHGDAMPSPMLTPLTSLLADAVGTGVRVLLSGAPNLAAHRLAAAVDRRFVHECADAQDYAALGVPRGLRGAVDGLGRAVDVSGNRLVQFALVPADSEAPAADVVRAIGWRLSERWRDSENSPLRPVAIRELPWPLPMLSLRVTPPAAVVSQPVSLCVDPDTGEVVWLDADEDGPVFVVCGSPRSGRSNALLAGASLMADRGWRVVGLPLSRRSPVSEASFPGAVVSAADLESYADAKEPVALFIDDVHRWTGEADGLRSLLDGPGPRAVIVAGPSEFFGEHGDLVRTFGKMRSGLVLAPQSSMDAYAFGVRRLSDEVMREDRPGRGVLAVAGELSNAQVPLVQTGARDSSA